MDIKFNELATSISHSAPPHDLRQVKMDTYLDDVKAFFLARYLSSPTNELPAVEQCDSPNCRGTHANQKCSGCRCVFYCDVSCQKTHWKQYHKQACAALKNGSLRVQSDISAVDAKVLEYERLHTEECAICYEVMGTRAIRLNCTHSFCGACIKVEHLGMSFPCPLCKHPQDLQTIYFNLINNIELFILKASSYPHGSDECVKYASDYAKVEHNKLISSMGDKTGFEANYAALQVMEAEILYLQGNYHAAIEASEAGITKLNAIPAHELQGHWQSSQKTFITRALANITVSNISQGNYISALQALQRQVTVLDLSKKTRGVAAFFRNMSTCMFHLENYQEAIKAGESAVNINRTYEGTYRPIVLSYKALGKLDHAIWCAQRAVRYETPWDEGNKQRVSELLRDLITEKQASGNPNPKPSVPTNDAVDYCRIRWHALCNLAGITSQDIIENTWISIAARYTETHRFYHTLEHIRALLDQIKAEGPYRSSINNIVVVELSVFFHDIIYDPKSSTNEEDSVVLFRDLLGSHLTPAVVTAVEAFILATKTHKLPSTNDTTSDQVSDLKLFLDLDMEVLSRPRSQYQQYASEIRSEYIHVNEEVYCQRRAAFLRKTLAAGAKSPIYWTHFFSDHEQVARKNIEWECQLLEQGFIPSKP